MPRTRLDDPLGLSAGAVDLVAVVEVALTGVPHGGAQRPPPALQLHLDLDAGKPQRTLK